MNALIILALITINPNPAAGPNNDWAPLTAQYSACEETATSYFSYTVCTAGAMSRALNPTYTA